MTLVVSERIFKEVLHNVGRFIIWMFESQTEVRTQISAIISEWKKKVCSTLRAPGGIYMVYGPGIDAESMEGHLNLSELSTDR